MDTTTSPAIPPSEARERWIAVGQSSDSDAHTAGSAATRQALRDSDGKLLVVFFSDAFDLPDLLAGINQTSGGIPLVGCSTAGEIATGGPDDASVVVVAFGGPGFSIDTAVATGVSANLRQAGAEAAACIHGVDERPHRIVLLLTDGLAGDQQEIVRGAYGVLGAGIPLVGGCAGDDLRMRQTSQLYHDQVLHDAVVAAAVASDTPFGIGVRYGWRKTGSPMLVTKSANNRVYQLDDQPALDVYLERLNAPPQARSDPAAFTRFALTHPLGVSRRSGEEVRFVGEANFQDRSLGCIAEVPQGGLTWFMEGDEGSVLEATDSACDDALRQLGGWPPAGILAFDCIARRGVLGEEGIRREIQRVAQQAGGAPVAGFYTYGEIARTHGISGFHNQTLVVLAMS
jgi:hypothetical protein